MLFTMLAFFAGVITVFAPCVFVLLPVIVGGSISGDVHDKRRPFLIVAGAATSLLVFTLLLKATTLFIAVPPAVITGIAGGIIITLGLVLLFPRFYDRILIALNLQAKSQQLLGSGNGKGPIVGALITGAALGPVFSSCSPVYAYILASVLPVDFGVAMVYMVAYIAGLSMMLLLIGFLGQRIVRRLKWAANPRGVFTKVVAVMFIVVGLLIVTGYDKKFQTFIAEYTPFDFDHISAQFIPDENPAEKTNSGVLNVEAYKAPEITGIEDWINSDPLTIKQLRGKVVLIDFWTYSCINCIRTQPYLKDWYKTYNDSGFEIIGVHAPEFSFERVKSNVVQAAKDAGLNYPIAMDNDFATWQAYENQYWPATYLIDAEGNVRREHFGEGEYKEAEQAIRQLLTEAGITNLPEPTTDEIEDGSSRLGQTPETYFGINRAEGYAGTDALREGEYSYKLTTPGTVNQWTLGGTWDVNGEGMTAIKDSVLRFRVAAKDVYLVTGTGKGMLDVMLDGKPISTTDSAGRDVTDSKVTITKAQLYRIVSFDEFNGNSLIELKVPAGIKLHTFTFGS